MSNTMQKNARKVGSRKIMRVFPFLLSAWLTSTSLALTYNSAVVPTPRTSPGWEKQFQSNLDRTKAGDAVIIFDGDSITDWWRTKGRKEWEKTFVPYGVANFGIAGDLTQAVLWRLKNGQGKGMHPKLIVLMIGTNNLKWSDNTDEQTAAGVKAVVDEYKRMYPTARILLQGIFPRGETASHPMRARIENINAMIGKLGDGQRVIFLDFGDKFLEPDGTISREVMPDFLHPSARGYEIWAEQILPVVQKVVGKK